MPLTLGVPEITELQPKILVFGVGGAGGNAVNNMIQSELKGVEFVVGNTDAQALAHSLCDRRIQLGTQITQGLGAGARPDIGAAAAQEAIDQIKEELAGANMAFITAGMGGGTGTGAAPVVAKLAREMGILTVGVVTKPFQFEGSRRMAIAGEGLDELHKHVDTLIIIPNQNLFSIANEKTTFADAFAMADNVLHSGVRGITDLMVMPGLINLDFADVRTVMMEMGKAMMGTGEAEGEGRARDAAEDAISNPLLDEISMKGAKGVLINITGGEDLTLFEVEEAANRIRGEVDPEANIIVGSTLNNELNGSIRVSVFATGIEVDPSLMRAGGMTINTVEKIEPKLVPSEPEPVTFASPVAEAVAEEPAARPSFEAPVAKAPKSVPLEERQAPSLGQDVGTDAFIAPEPMKVIDDFADSTPAEPAEVPNPFAEADVINGGLGGEPKRPAERGPSLFQRLRGRGRPTEPEPAINDLIETLPEVEPEEEPLTLSDRHPADVEHQPHGGGVSEEQIDIPAFLRRQAN